MAPKLPPPASPLPNAPSPLAAGRRLSQHGYSVSVSASKQGSLDRDRASSGLSGNGRLWRRLQVNEALDSCTTITVTYSAESDLESISDEIDSLSAQATSYYYSLRSTATDRLLLHTTAHVCTTPTPYRLLLQATLDNATLAELEEATDENSISGCEMTIATRSEFAALILTLTLNYPSP